MIFNDCYVSRKETMKITAMHRLFFTIVFIISLPSNIHAYTEYKEIINIFQSMNIDTYVTGELQVVQNKALYTKQEIQHNNVYTTTNNYLKDIDPKFLKKIDPTKFHMTLIDAKITLMAPDLEISKKMSEEIEDQYNLVFNKIWLTFKRDLVHAITEKLKQLNEKIKTIENLKLYFTSLDIYGKYVAITLTESETLTILVNTTEHLLRQFINQLIITLNNELKNSVENLNQTLSIREELKPSIRTCTITNINSPKFKPHISLFIIKNDALKKTLSNAHLAINNEPAALIITQKTTFKEDVTINEIKERSSQHSKREYITSNNDTMIEIEFV